MRQLPIFLNVDGREVILIGEGAAAEAKRLLLERAGARIVGADSLSARIAVVAVDEEAEAYAAANVLKRRGVLVNVVDCPALCDFTMPAIVDRSPVLIAIGTGGASAGLAKALRQRLEAMLPAALGPLAMRLFGARRRLRERWPDPRERRRAIDAAFGMGEALDPLACADPDAVDHWFEAGGELAAPAQHLLELTSADPDDLTLRQARLLASADRIYHDDDVPSDILARGRADAVRLPLRDAARQVEGEVVVTVIMRR